MNEDKKPIEVAFDIARHGAAPKPKGLASIQVCRATELPDGGVKIVSDESGRSIGVFRRAEEFFALRNVCPHQGAPLCQGGLYNTYQPGETHQFEPTLEGRVLRCPWHGWEFDIETGKGLYDARSRVQTYAVRVDDEGILWVDL